MRKTVVVLIAGALALALPAMAQEEESADLDFGVDSTTCCLRRGYGLEYTLGEV